MILDFIKNRKYTIILILVILVILVYAGASWYESRIRLVDIGLANPSFPFRKYSLLELARQGKITDSFEESKKLIEVIKNLPTQVTPQETFEIYIKALKDGDINGALNCFTSGQDEQKKLREILYNFKDQRTLEKIIEISEEINKIISWNDKSIEKGSTGESSIYYKYPCISNDNFCEISFDKDFYGNWKINKLD